MLKAFAMFSFVADRLQRAATHALDGPRPILESRYVSKDARCAAGFDEFSLQIQNLRLRGGQAVVRVSGGQVWVGVDLCLFGIRGVGRAVFVWGDLVGFRCGGCVVGFAVIGGLF